MKTLSLTLLLIAALAAGCGGDHNHDDNGGHSHGDGSGHDDHHSGPRHVMGQTDLGDGYHVTVAHLGSIEAGKELVLEVEVEKDGKEVKDASVTVWLGDKDGKEATRREKADWRDDEQCYDGHLRMPPQASMPEGGHIWVSVRHGGKEMKKGYDITGHNHD